MLLIDVDEFVGVEKHVAEIDEGCRVGGGELGRQIRRQRDRFIFFQPSFDKRCLFLQVGQRQLTLGPIGPVGTSLVDRVGER